MINCYNIMKDINQDNSTDSDPRSIRVVCAPFESILVHSSGVHVLAQPQFCKDQLFTPPNPSDKIDNLEITNTILLAQLDEARPLVDGNNIFFLLIKI